MSELSQHNVTNVRLKPTIDQTTGAGMRFFTRKFIIEHDEGADTTLLLFSKDRHALCVPIDPEADQLWQESIDELKKRNTELVDKLMDRSERNDGLRKLIEDRDKTIEGLDKQLEGGTASELRDELNYWKEKAEELALEISDNIGLAQRIIERN